MRLLHETDKFYHVSDGKRHTDIPKEGLSEKNHASIQKLAKGGAVRQKHCNCIAHGGTEVCNHPNACCGGQQYRQNTGQEPTGDVNQFADGGEVSNLGQAGSTTPNDYGVGQAAYNMVRPGQYPTQPAPSPRQEGESDKAYSARVAHEQIQEMGSPEGVQRGMAMAAGVGGGSSEEAKLAKATMAKYFGPQAEEVAQHLHNVRQGALPTGGTPEEVAEAARRLAAEHFGAEEHLRGGAVSATGHEQVPGLQEVSADLGPEAEQYMQGRFSPKELKAAETARVQSTKPGAKVDPAIEAEAARYARFLENNKKPMNREVPGAMGKVLPQPTPHGQLAQTALPGPVVPEYEYPNTFEGRTAAARAQALMESETPPPVAARTPEEQDYLNRSAQANAEIARLRAPEQANYTMSHREGPHGTMIVEATDPQGHTIGRAHLEPGEKTIFPHMVNVSPFEQQKGLAGSMYKYAENVTGKKMEPSGIQTEQGKALWAGKNRPFGKLDVRPLEKAHGGEVGYKMLEENDTHFNLQHPSGKKFRVAKEGLGEKMHARIRAYAEGGEVKKFAEGGEPDYSTPPGHGDEVTPPVFDVGASNLRSQEAAGAIHAAAADRPPESQPGLEEKAAAIESKPGVGTPPVPAPGMGDLQAANAPTGTNQYPVALNGTRDEQGNLVPATAIGGLPPAAPAPKAPGSPIPSTAKEEAAISEKARLEAEGYKAEAENQNTLLKQRMQQSADFQQTLAARNAKSDEMFKDFMSSKVDPEHYWKDQNGNPDTSKSITASIAMLISGIGAGLMHGPNLAVEQINKAIDRDIDAQKANIQTKSTALTAYGNQTNNLISQYNLAKADALDAAAAQTAKNTAETNSRVAQQNGIIAAEELRRRAAVLRQEATLREQQIASGALGLNMQKAQMQAIQRIAGGGEMTGNDRMFLPKDLQERYVEIRDPNSGKVITGGFADSPAQKAEYDKSMIESDLIRQKVDMLKSLVAKNPRGGIPFSTAQNQIETLKADILTSMNNLAGLNRLNPQEMAEYQQRLGAVGHWNLTNATRAMEQLDLLGSDISQRVHSTNMQLLHKNTPLLTPTRAGGQ